MTVDPELERGLEGRYRLERELGHGGTAVVWLAHDLKHDRPVAFKLLHQSLASSLGPARFQREIRFAARLQHPHILTVLDSGETAGRLWFTMPYVEGETLRARLTRERRLPLDEAARIVREAGQALQHAHEQGVVHRDIKPENILLTRDGSTLVADFGIARAVSGADADGATTSTLTETGLIIGTPTYMSPEQVTGTHPVDARTDVYALGCVLYEMLSGVPPFSGPTPQAVAMRHATEPAPNVTAANPQVPAGVSGAIARALAKDPAERFSSPRELVAVLDASVQAGKTRNPRSRTVWLAGSAALLLLGVVIWQLAHRTQTASAAVASGFNRRLAQLTSGEGIEEWPAWSPDGKRLAYAAEIGGYLQIVVRDVASGDERQLTGDARDHIQPAWSPDGRRLAYVRGRQQGGKLAPSDVYGWYYENGDIWIVDASGGTGSQIVGDAFGPTFSPDGKSLAFDAPWGGARRIWVADVSGRNARQLTSDSSDAIVHAQPRWSPDGRRLVFRRAEKIQSDIAVVELGSQSITRLTADAAIDLDPTWGPDGRTVYFASARGGGLNLWRLALSESGMPEGQPQQLTTGAGDDIEPAVRPGGEVGFAVRGINSDIWRLPVSPETGKPTGEPEPVAASTRVESRGSWSPDGSAIAFNSDRLGQMNIWIRSLSSGRDRQLTTGVGGDYQPQWSPDGKRVVFFSARGGNNDIWSIESAGGEPTRLTSDPAMDINPFYSPDGQRIAFMSDRSGRFEVWTMQSDGADQRRLTEVGAWGHFMRWTDDGAAIIFRADDWTRVRIYRVSVADGSLTELPPVESGGHMSLSPSRTLILDVRGHRTIRAFPTNGSSPYNVYEFTDPDLRVDYPVWSPDGRWVLFDRAEPRGGDLWTISNE